MPWALLHAGWHRPHAQHDVAEHLACFRRILIPDLHLGGWQCRLYDTAPGAGAPSICLFLATPPSQLVSGTSERLTIQRMLSHWYSQANVGDADCALLRFCLRCRLINTVLTAVLHLSRPSYIYSRFFHGVDSPASHSNISLPLPSPCCAHPPGPESELRTLQSFPLLIALGGFAPLLR